MMRPESSRTSHVERRVSSACVALNSTAAPRSALTAQQVEHAIALRRIEIRRGLVGQQQARPLHDRLRDRREPKLAVGELRWFGLGAVSIPAVLSASSACRLARP